ncbi:hypothetical protein LCGC14_1821790 [marine sediment metagenome]|uniref:Uncharacterized protein n=1 Tax=marine sediment metagenome TaxID=412755 RepID=A0A0F9IYF6_9ZZZZ
MITSAVDYFFKVVGLLPDYDDPSPEFIASYKEILAKAEEMDRDLQEKITELLEGEQK